jgi:hypothetical protein
MIVVHLIRFGLRLCFSGFFQSSIERSSYFSCEKHYVRLDYLSALDRPNGSSLTCRWLDQTPSDELYMTRVCESLQMVEGDLSTDADLSCGKALAVLWTTQENKIAFLHRPRRDRFLDRLFLNIEYGSVCHD